MAFNTGVHYARRASVPKAADDEKRANRGHAFPKGLRQMYIAGYNASGDEEVEGCEVPDRRQGFREELEILLCALHCRETDEEEEEEADEEERVCI